MNSSGTHGASYVEDTLEMTIGAHGAPYDEMPDPAVRSETRVAIP